METPHISSHAIQSFPIDAQVLYKAIVNSTEDYIYIVDMSADLALVSENMAQDFALPGRLVPGLVPLWGELVHPRDQKRYFDSIDEMLAGRTDEHNVEYQVKNRGGEYVWVVCRGLLNRDEVGRPVTFAGVVAPIANKGKIDPTTGLFTQGECRKRVERLLEQAEAPGGILLLGLDDFKRINNLKNHIFGDSVLRQIAQDLQRLLPPQAEAYRFDGDEFAVVCPGASPEEMEQLYRTIHLCANREREVDGTPYFCTISGGTAQIGRDADNYLDLLKYAESALEASKDGGKNRCTAFTPDLLKQRIRKMALTSCLQQSVRSGMEHFSLVYQPFVRFEEGGGLRLIGAEALLRWSCEPFGPVSPVEFIPLLESSGLIIQLGRWVLEEAVATCKRWLDLCPDFVMNVNVSYLQLADKAFVPFVLDLLERYELAPRHLVLELTESCFVTDMPALREAFQGLRGSHIQIAMDDFGTGYSSLGMLTQMPADIVKIDRLFISLINDQTHEFNRAFIAAVIQLCHSVGISVCVEGVEQLDELKTVQTLNADSVQGYYVSRPIAREAFEEKYWPVAER